MTSLGRLAACYGRLLWLTIVAQDILDGDHELGLLLVETMLPDCPTVYGYGNKVLQACAR